MKKKSPAVNKVKVKVLHFVSLKVEEGQMKQRIPRFPERESKMMAKVGKISCRLSLLCWKCTYAEFAVKPIQFSLKIKEDTNI